MQPNVSLVVALGLATHLIRVCNRTPNTPRVKYDKDKLFAIPFVKEHGPVILEYLFVIPCVYHIVLTATLRDREPSALCPHPNHPDHKYFTWSPYTVICLSIIFASATLRLLAFRTLGKNFTFELAQPDRLITTGIYAYVQHPSYGPLFVLICATVMLFLPLDGALGCLLPFSAVELWITWHWYILACIIVIMSIALGVRVRDEEAMLKETFGKAWIEWNQRTPRFVPYLF
ncbi:uncharacterized protein PV09_01350 [Verruconis gallopava]|uniref:Protein-S-isoprenylcysteine O-methyltransferase n=1 Tax=Verruconis gallopava TaxID=253628 RepID=A0A0D1Z673_9PEZI|nr:uncharacterized protein PV09_01350 [Verruconis gallopava]KIW08447.1 hypothetical protein PV09_01350 [Verruconis gallopava]